MDDYQTYKPEILIPSDRNFSERFNELIAGLPESGLLDVYLEQQRELIKIDNPKVSRSEAIKEIQDSINDSKILSNEGCWVYYPWRNAIIHILKEDDFVKLRTSRNLYKITASEQELLIGKKVGIIGLSVGHSVAMTLALERSVGELRLADFDNLELSNLNRIRSNILNIGLPKTTIAAREIAELDPFIEIHCYHEGINEENLHRFFTENGNLDALVEECDSLDIKILSRLKAKELGIPVLMETSDRGMLDIERFDLEPSRPILHGMIDHLDYRDVKKLKTSEEKIPFLMPMVGIETMSPRLKASALEVGNSLTTWPQIGTSVLLGGAVLSDTYRRLMLGQFNKSGRYIVDPSDVLGIDESEHSEKKSERKRGGLSRVEMLQQVNYLNRKESEGISNEHILSIVEASGHAPSGGNSQPWKWLYSKGRLYLFLDKSSSDSFMDYHYSASYISLGACYENARIMAENLGYRVDAAFFPLENNHALVLEMNLSVGKTAKNALAKEIPRRYTDRQMADRSNLEQTALKELIKMSLDFPDLETIIIDDQDKIDVLGDVISSGDWLRVMNPESHRDFIVEEMRWTRDEIEKEKNGIFVEELNLSPGDLSGLYLLKDERVIDFLNRNNHGNGLKNISSKLVSSAPVLMAVFSSVFDRKSFFDAGAMLERMWLYCTKENIGFQVMNVPLAFLLRYKKNDIQGLNSKFKKEVESMVEKMEKVFPDYLNKTDLLLIRLFNTGGTEPTSLRREVNDIVEFE